jgi:hypothetical protein
MRETVPKTISMPTKVLQAGMKRAKSQNRKFSNYVKTLIDRDVAQAKRKKTAEPEVAVAG